VSQVSTAANNYRVPPGGSRNATSCTLSRYFVMTNYARWRRKSVPVGLRGKGCEVRFPSSRGM
jgi:hypothetical protein